MNILTCNSKPISVCRSGILHLQHKKKIVKLKACRNLLLKTIYEKKIARITRKTQEISYNCKECQNAAIRLNKLQEITEKLKKYKKMQEMLKTIARSVRKFSFNLIN